MTKKDIALKVADATGIKTNSREEGFGRNI